MRRQKPGRVDQDREHPTVEALRCSPAQSFSHCRVRRLQRPDDTSASQVVLAWLQGHPSNWKTFVANIITQLSSARWGRVRTHDNLANLATGGLPPDHVYLSIADLKYLDAAYN